MPQTTLAEDLLLLAYYDEGGSPALTAIDYGLAGALLAELVLAGRLTVSGDEVSVIDRSPTGEAAADVVLEQVAGSNEIWTAEKWVGRLAAPVKGQGLSGESRSEVHERLLARLVEKGILRMEHRKVLWLFPVRRYPTADRAAETAARERLDWIFRGGAPDVRATALLAFTYVCRLRQEVFPETKASEMRARLQEMHEYGRSSGDQEPHDAIWSIAFAVDKKWPRSHTY